MKSVFFLICSLSFSNLVEEINKNPKSSWKATEYPLSTLENIRSRLIQPWVFHHVTNKPASVRDVDSAAPDSFDARDRWPGIILPVYNEEEGCAAGSAIAVIQTVSDRVGIINKAKTVYSLQDVLFCDPNSYGCDGDDPNVQWDYIQKTGIALDSCIPYDSSRSCPRTCADGSPINRTLPQTVYSVSGVDMMETELMTFGPFQVLFAVYEDFLSYTSGVYHHTHGMLLGGGTGLAVGWGVSDDGTRYWIVELSWGDDFGLNGYAWIQKGSDECGIEDDGYAAQF